MSTLPIPEQKIINIAERFGEGIRLEVIDISQVFELERINARLCHIPVNHDMEISAPSGMNQICYIISGKAELKKDGETASVIAGDSFAFVAGKTDISYSLATQGVMVDVLVITDIQKSGNLDPKNEQVASGLPTIVNAVSAAEWKGNGIDATKVARLVSLTDLKALEERPWGLNLEQIPPGTQSSNAHAHSHEDEFAIILSGAGRYWHQGESPERILKPGDIVGWKAGTGICHTLLNDALDEEGDGQDLVFIVWGGNLEEDLVHYAVANPPWWKDEYKWKDRPLLDHGPASAVPRYPRPESRKYPQE